MNPLLLTADIASWALQIGILLGVGLLLPALFRCRSPRVRLVYGHGLLLTALLLPVLPLWPGPAGPSARTAVRSLAVVTLSGPGAPAVAPEILYRVVLWTLAFGVGARLLWMGTGLWRLASLRRSAVSLDSLPEPLAELPDKVGAGARFYLSDCVAGPATFGWLRPAILLPRSFLGLPTSAQQGIVCHELLHVRRRDWPVVLGEEGIRALLWFHPLVWLLLRRLALSREQVVDGEAVRITGERRPYLEALLRLAAGREGRVYTPSLSFHHRGALHQRVAALTQEVSMSRTRAVTTAAGLAVLTALAVAGGLDLFPITGAAFASPAAGVKGVAEPPSPPLQIAAEPRRPAEGLPQPTRAIQLPARAVRPKEPPAPKQAIEPAPESAAPVAVPSTSTSTSTSVAAVEAEGEEPPAAAAPAAEAVALPEMAAAPVESVGLPAPTDLSQTTEKRAEPEETADFQPPRAIHPVWPKLTTMRPSLQVGTSRAIVLDASIDERGDVTGVAVVQRGRFDLENATKSALLQWKFEPARRDGRPVPSTTRLSFKFKP